MRTYKLLLSLGTLTVALAGAYVSFIYLYTDHMFTPISFLVAPNPAAPQQEWTAPHVAFIHKVNTPARARKKDAKFGGFEVDVLSYQGNLLAAHDPREAQRNILLEDIFKAVKKPAQKVWWLDVKGELTDTEIDEIVSLASRHNISHEHLLFEASAGPTAKRIKQKKLALLLPLPDGFDQDHNDPEVRAKLNADVLVLWEEYQPLAVSASFGKYAYLQAYFPNMAKAIYYSATQRPSLKKYLMRRHLRRDPSVRIFMTDEYDWVNL